jgi:hypothetical protein
MINTNIFSYYFFYLPKLFLNAFQVVIRNVHIRRGLLMLVPEVIKILGGVVDYLEAVHDRLVSEVNKPPRGKRYKFSFSETQIPNRFAYMSFQF